MKIQITVAVIVVSIGLVAFWLWPYSDAFTAEYDQVADNVVSIIEENPTVEGVDKALKYYQSKQFSLREKKEWGLKPDKNGAISEAVRSGYMSAFSRTSYKMHKLEEKYPNIKKQIEYLDYQMFKLD